MQGEGVINLTRFSYPTVDALVEEARTSTGLDDFGTGDFGEGLGQLLESVARELTLSGDAAMQIVATIRQRLVNRLEVEAWYRDHPEIDDLGVGASVSITGLPRTGTTALANILSLDDQFRCLRRWEQSQCCPPPVFGEEDGDPRRLAALADLERLEREQPELMAMHLWDPEATEEDVEVLGMSFRAQQFALPIFDYHAWWRDADLDATYAYQRRVIKLLQSRRPPHRWLFKAPAHNFHLDAFFKAYPDARVIMTHRDPAKAVPSTMSFVSAFQPQATSLTPQQWGPKRAEHLRVGAERAMVARKRIGEHHFLDVHHRDFVADPFGTLEQIYDFVGLELHSDTRVRMEAWHARNRTGAHGSHRYTADQYGLSEAQLRADYGAYIERYGVPLEGAASC
ncbi:MAG: sulfotransferase family protein [Acidimicrobiales bacterium]